jgi:hypothetical protein
MPQRKGADTYSTVRFVRKDESVVLKDHIIVVYGMLQHGTVRYGTVRYCMVRYGAVSDNWNVNNNVWPCCNYNTF